jgi:hypothetical protein
MATKVIAVVLESEVDYVALEDTYLGKNAKTRQLLDWLAGAIRWQCYCNNIVVYSGVTAQIDKACGIPTGLKRPRRKGRTKLFAEMQGFDYPENVCDALCVGHWGVGERRQAIWNEQSE